MISWNECDVQFAKHSDRIGRIERDGWMVAMPAVNRRGRRVGASSILVWVSSRAGAGQVAVKHWLDAGKRVVEVS